jgi:hypothetical protein
VQAKVVSGCCSSRCTHSWAYIPIIWAYILGGVLRGKPAPGKVPRMGTAQGANCLTCFA